VTVPSVEDGAGDGAEAREGSGVAVPQLGVLRRGGRVGDDGDLEAVLEQFAQWLSMHRLADMPARTTSSMRRSRSCSTTSFCSGPYTLCGLQTMV
jgi:hypothetical protein